MLYQPIPVQRCTKCHQYFPATLEYFYKKSGNRLGIEATCKKCACQRNKQWRTDNPQKSALKSHRWFQNNRDKQRNRVRRWAKSHREIIREYGARSRRENADRHRSKWREYSHRRRAILRQLPHEFSELDWTRSVDYFKGRCAYCGRPQGLWHTLAQDHFIPLSSDGTYTPDNIVPACHGIDGCNNSKKDRNPHEWLIERFGPRKAKQIEQRIADYFAWVKEQTKH